MSLRVCVVVFATATIQSFRSKKALATNHKWTSPSWTKKIRYDYFPSLARVPFRTNRKEKDEQAGEKYKKMAYPSLSDPLGSLANIIVRTEKQQSNNLTGFSVRSRRKRASTQSRENWVLDLQIDLPGTEGLNHPHTPTQMSARTNTLAHTHTTRK